MINYRLKYRVIVWGETVEWWAENGWIGWGEGWADDGVRWVGVGAWELGVVGLGGIRGRAGWVPHASIDE